MTVPATGNLTLRFVKGFSDIDRAGWDALALPLDTPFLEWDWLNLLETSNSASPATGWHPTPLLALDGETLVGGAALYIKWHSEGEFVFDQLWAEAASRLALPYYPRLVGASPFTPATGYRFLLDPAVNPTPLSRRMFEAMERMCRAGGLHGGAMLFPEPDFAAAAEDFGYTSWRHQSYLWRNQGYAGFEDYLESLNANRRKTVRRERQKLAEAGIKVEVVAGEAIPEAWFPLMYRLYEGTNAKFGPWGCRYLTQEFFEGLARVFRHRLAFAAAFKAGAGPLPVGLAMLVHKGAGLWGRYWGASADIPYLHFELCYYAPITWAISRGMARYDPGMGGAHKARRGFVSVSSLSCHRFYDPRLDLIFRSHIERVNDLEQGYIEELNELLPRPRRQCRGDS